MVKGIRVAQGKSITRAKPQELTYSTDQISPKVEKEDRLTIRTDSSGNGSQPIDNTLGYTPVVFAYYTPASNANTISNPTFFPWIRWNREKAWAFADNSIVSFDVELDKIDFRINNGTANTVYTIKYFIFAEPAKND